VSEWFTNHPLAHARGYFKGTAVIDRRYSKLTHYLLTGGSREA